MDANSLSHDVINTLHQAMSSNAHMLKEAQQRLQKWEAEPGFYAMLMCIFTDKNIDVNVRWQAILYVKNGVDRNWRRHTAGAIKEEERVKIKSMLLENFHEPADQLAVHLAVVIGKVARLDCPKHWPELLPALINAITTEREELRLQRILLSFHQVIKSLSTRRLAHDRKIFEELTKGIFDIVVEIWKNQMSQFELFLNEGSIENAHLVLRQYAHPTLKVLRKLVVYGFKTPQNQENAKQFVHSVFYGVNNMVEAGRSFPKLIDLSNTWNKMLLLYSKILLDMLQYHPETYVQYIVTSLQLVCNLCFSDVTVTAASERFNVNLLNLMKDILNNDSYRLQTLRVSDETEGFAVTAYKIIRSTMNNDLLVDILRTVVYRYLLLTPADLEMWQHDPEEYVNDEGGDSYKYSIRPCVETLLATLFKEFKPVLSPVLLDMVRETELAVDPSDINSLLKRDALYNAFGLAAYDIYDDVDFDSWLQTHLIPQLRINLPNYQLIKRRVIWLIGNWVTVKLSVAARPALYEIVLKLLAEDEDIVVRIETALTLKSAVDDFEFTYQQYSPYMEPSFHLLFQLLTHVQSCDSKMQVLHVMSFIIERSGSHITPHCQMLIGYLPSLWQESEEHNMLRCAIVTTLTRLVQGMGSESKQLSAIVLPVIQLSVDITKQAHVYLLEDGLQLWLATIYNSTECSPDLLELFSVIPALIDLSTENLQVCLKIISGYTLLSGQQLIMRFGDLLVECLCTLVTDIKSEGLIFVMRTVEIFFKLLPKEASQLFKKLFISWIMPAILDGESYPMVMSLYLCLVSRLVLNDYNTFLGYISDYSQVNHKQQGEVLSEFMQTWFEKLDCISESERRKVCALAIAALIPTDLGASEQGLDPMVNACVQVMHDVCTSVANEGSLQISDSVYFDQTDPVALADVEADNAHEKRKHQVSRQDLVFNVRLDQFVRSQLSKLCTAIGQERFQQLMSNIDPDIVSQLQNFMTRPLT